MSTIRHSPAALKKIRNLAYQTIFDLEDEYGIAASSRSEAYGCLFGRDSAITILKLLRVYERTGDQKLLAVCKKTLLSHISLQGKAYQLESGEEPGKFIHEYRPTNYERLINRPRPWFVYPDGILRNYDSVDATPLLLTALCSYWRVTQDAEFLEKILPNVKLGLHWLMGDADKDGDGFIEYELPTNRLAGGLVVQSWADSFASLTQSDGSFPVYPIAAVEVQAITWLCYQEWLPIFSSIKPDTYLANQLKLRCEVLTIKFATSFLFQSENLTYAAQALDGRKRRITTVTANPLLCLWASVGSPEGGVRGILSTHHVEQFVRRAFKNDLFDSRAGMRTMSSRSPLFDPSTTSYHNGSFWPMLNGLIHEGLEKWGFVSEAGKLRDASLYPLLHFQTPIELYCSTQKGVYAEYESVTGKKGCRFQAWTAAAILDWLDS